MSLLVLIFIVSVRLLVRLFRIFPLITVLGVCHSVQQVFKIFSTWGHKASMRTDVISVAAWNTHFMHLFKHFVLSLLLSSDRLIKISHIVNDFHNLVEDAFKMIIERLEWFPIGPKSTLMYMHCILCNIILKNTNKLGTLPLGNLSENCSLLILFS